jgi:hypothetical protein
VKSDDIPVVKAALTRKINEARHTLVIVGEDCNKQHKAHREIGYRNWQIFEIVRSKANGNRLVAVKLDKGNVSPAELLNAGADWAMGFTYDAIKKALDGK